MSLPICLAGRLQVQLTSSAMERFTPNTPTHEILTTFLRSHETGVHAGAIEPCAYCNTLCGETVRRCAELRGRRKDLKAKIRHIDERVLPSNEEKVRVLKGRRATTAAWDMESLDSQIKDVEKEVLRLERVLAKLYEAYNQWPNPKRVTNEGGRGEAAGE